MRGARVTDLQTETGGAIAAKLAPPATVLGVQVAGIHVADWIQWLTLLYLALMIAHKLWSMGLEAWRFWHGPERKRGRK